MARTATIVRETSESKVELSLNLDGTGKTDIDTSVPFYNHMMTALGKHSLIDLKIKATLFVCTFFRFLFALSF